MADASPHAAPPVVGKESVDRIADDFAGPGIGDVDVPIPAYRDGTGTCKQGPFGVVLTDAAHEGSVVVKNLDDVVAPISNKNVADELGGLPPVKMHCSVLAEQGIAAAMIDFFSRNPQLTPPEGLMEKAKRLEELDPHGWPEEGEGE